MRGGAARFPGPMIRRTLAIGIVLAATAAAPAAAAENTLTGRAILPADASAPGPFPASPNTDPAPAWRFRR